MLDALSAVGQVYRIDELEPRMVELDSGRFDDTIDPTHFDADRAAASPVDGVDIPPQHDLAGRVRVQPFLDCGFQGSQIPTWPRWKPSSTNA